MLLERIEGHPLGRRYLRFWTEYRVAPEVLALFRLLFFGVLAVDMWLQVQHAPRYGAGDFNVSHLPALDAHLPVLTRPAMAFLYIVQAYLAALVALGGGGRAALIALTSLFGVTYFSSQLDSYQHHYLMFLVLLVLCFVRWEAAPEPAKKGAPPPPGAWPVRLVLVQLSILYFYAAVAKMDALWWDGRVMQLQISAGWARDLIERVGGFSFVSKMVVATELSLAFAIHVRSLRRFVAPIGILFHTGIEASGFQIGLFSYFMIALYVLMLPEAPIVRLVQWVHRHVPAVPLVTMWAPLARLILRASAIALGAAVVLLVPIGTPALVASAVVLALGAAALFAVPRERRDRHAVAHLAGCLLVAFLARPSVTDVARDYYRFWGGSARRLGDLATATEKYQRAVELAPDHAQSHVSLGNLYQMTGKSDLALREAERAELLEPDSYRGYLLEAIIRDAAGEGHGALAAAEKALEHKPDERQAFSIASRWRRTLDMPPPERRSAPAETGDDDEDDD